MRSGTSKGLLTGALLVAFVAWPLQVQAQGLSLPIKKSDESAIIERDKITFFLPLPYDRLEIPKTPLIGYFVWRVTVETRRPFSIVVTSDSALRTSKAADVLRASTVRLCANPMVESARACTAPINAKMLVEPDHFRVIIHDADLVMRVRRERTDTYWRYLVEPTGRYQLSQHPFAPAPLDKP